MGNSMFDLIYVILGVLSILSFLYVILHILDYINPTDDVTEVDYNLFYAAVLLGAGFLLLNVLQALLR